MEYRIVRTFGQTTDELLEKVRALIAQGWEPLGGISQAMYETEAKLVFAFAQAMIKR